MSGVDRVKELCKQRKIPLSRLEKDLGYGNGYIAQLRKGVFPSDRLIEIANYLGVTTDYIISGAEKNAPATVGKGANKDIQLSDTELELIQKFRRLDARGRSAVMNVLNYEYTSLAGDEGNSLPKQA